MGWYRMASSKLTMEVIAVTIADAVAAEKGGADRLELIDNYVEGGTTPSAGIVRAVKRAVSIPVYVMIRPHGGGFVYSQLEVDAMVEDAALARKAGADGIVVGALRKDGTIDIETITRVIEAARLPVTFHRAFDEIDPKYMPAALDQLAEIPRIKRVLTSGGHPTPWEGKDVIAGLVKKDALTILAGGGIDSASVGQLVTDTGVTEVHIGTAAREPHTPTSPVDESHVRKLRELLG